VDAIDRMSGRIRERVGESLRSIRAGEPLAAVTTSSVDALRKLVDATRLSDRGEYAAAIALLNDAVAIDTAFAMAWRKISILEFNRPTPGSPARMREAARRAYQHRDRLTELERHLAAANYHNVVEVNDDAEIQDYLSALRIDPEDPAALNNLALTYQQRHRFQDAAELLDRAVRSRYGVSAVAYRNHGRNYMFRGILDSARASQQRFEQAFPANWFAQQNRLTIETIARDSAAAHVAADQLARNENATVNVRAQGVGGGLFVDAAAGRIHEARTHIGEAIRYAETANVLPAAQNWAGNEVDLLIGIGDTVAARERLRYFLTRRWGRGGRPFLPTIGRLARLGQIDEARAYFDRWPVDVPDTAREPVYELNRKEALAAIQRGSGDGAGALTAYRELMAQRPCERCYRREIAEIEARQGRIREAIALLELVVEEPENLLTFALDRVLALERLGYLYEQAGDSVKAADAYARFADAWRNADPELQPRVRAALSRAERLVGEPRRN
jgi:tetratricopeptide (TPR) repeat protein